MHLLRPALAAVKALLVLTVVLGIAYPLAVTGVARLMPGRADGSMIVAQGAQVGSALLGQPSSPAPRWFEGRPSASDAAGDTSGGTNLAEGSAAQATAVQERERTLRAANPDAAGPIPADALTASGSGLDPDISPAYAAWQIPRVAAATGLSRADVTALVEEHTTPPLLGFVGTDHVNVTELNIALATRLGR
ncbi:MAG: potassium-transporting ATPase subunit KdpC [Tetrasphaera sp.]